jgi:peptide/nickel transport system permease protein
MKETGSHESRLGLAAVMALLSTLVIFLIANTVPGDPMLSQLGDLAASNKEFVAEWRAKWGLDLPLWKRYAVFLSRLFLECAVDAFRRTVKRLDFQI